LISGLLNIKLNIRGTRSSKGLYDYSSEDPRKLKEAYALFNEEIYQLAAMYPANAGSAISAATEKETTMAE
jgi:hypothetical protein